MFCGKGYAPLYDLSQCGLLAQAETYAANS
ncbi:MAG: hypothetical protein BMS9Abin36_0372 [Gammaproteobacteria bacterium]|nr:MAG: hypothetical protein BMS9Abin36_0372 [Gammaproteobacteria bacterium]